MMLQFAIVRSKAITAAMRARRSFYFIAATDSTVLQRSTSTRRYVVYSVATLQLYIELYGLVSFRGFVRYLWNTVDSFLYLVSKIDSTISLVVKIGQKA